MDFNSIYQVVKTWLSFVCLHFFSDEATGVCFWSFYAWSKIRDAL